MQRDAVAFAIQRYGAEAVWADGVNVFLHGAAVFDELGDGIANAAIGVEVNKQTLVAGNFLRLHDETTAIAIRVLEDAKVTIAKRVLWNFAAQHGSIKFTRPVKIRHRNIHPHGPVNFGISIAHFL